MTILIILLIAAAPALMIADVHSSAINRGLLGIWETTPFFQTGTNKQANIPKMAVTFLILFLVMLAAAAFAYRKFGNELSIAPFFIFPLYALVRLPHVLKNYKLNRNYHERLRRGQIERI